MKPDEPSGSRWKCATCGAFRPALDPLCDCGSYRWRRLGVPVEKAEALTQCISSKPKTGKARRRS